MNSTTTAGLSHHLTEEQLRRIHLRNLGAEEVQRLFEAAIGEPVKATSVQRDAGAWWNAETESGGLRLKGWTIRRGTHEACQIIGIRVERFAGFEPVEAPPEYGKQTRPTWQVVGWMPRKGVAANELRIADGMHPGPKP